MAVSKGRGSEGRVQITKLRAEVEDVSRIRVEDRVGRVTARVVVSYDSWGEGSKCIRRGFEQGRRPAMKSVWREVISVPQTVSFPLRSRGSIDGNSCVPNEASSSSCDVSLDLFLGRLNWIWQSCDFEDGFFVSRRSDDVSIGLLLNPLDCSSFGSNNKTYNSVGNPDLNRSLTRNIRVWSWRTSRDSQSSRSHSGNKTSSSCQVTFSLCSNLAKVFSCRQDLSLCRCNIFFSSCHYKDRFFSSNWSLDVSVCLGSKCFDFASYSLWVQRILFVCCHLNRSLSRSIHYYRGDDGVRKRGMYSKKDSNPRRYKE